MFSICKFLCKCNIRNYTLSILICPCTVILFPEFLSIQYISCALDFLSRIRNSFSTSEYTNVLCCNCSCSKFLSQILKIVVKNFSEMVPGKQTQKEGFRPLIFLTHSMRITLLIIIEFDPCIYAVKFNFIPFQVPLYQAADVIQNHA